MIEHEKKYYANNTSSLLKTLKDLGFTKIGTKKQKDTYYSRPDIDFMQTVECLRIREEDQNIEITYKPPTSQSMKLASAIWKEETNLTVNKDEAESAYQLLGALGCPILCVVDKTRTTYKKGQLTVAIDHIENLGDFIEIEILAKKADSSLTAAIENLANKLNLPGESVVTKPYRDLIMEQTATGK